MSSCYWYIPLRNMYFSHKLWGALSQQLHTLNLAVVGWLACWLAGQLASRLASSRLADQAGQLASSPKPENWKPCLILHYLKKWISNNKV